MNKDEMERRIVELKREIINLKRFYLAFKIVQCKECNAEVTDWESPIIFRVLNASRDSVCKKHRKNIDDFNREFA